MVSRMTTFGRSRAFASLFTVAAAVVVLLALPALASATYSSELKRYPYLTDVVETSATINWGTTRLSISGVVKYGAVGSEACDAHTATTTRTAITVGTTPEFQWKAKLTGLAPDTSYCYRIFMGTNPQIDLLGDDPTPEFKTQIPSGANTPFSFAVFGDWGYVDAAGQNTQQANLMQQIAQSGARFALTTGDNAYPSGSQTNYGDLAQTGTETSGVFGPSFWKVAGSKIPLFPTMGNHGFSGATSHLTNWPQDVAVASSNGRYLRETHCCLNGTTSGDYPSTWYAFDAGKARFYVLEAAWTGTNLGTTSEYANDHAYHWTPTSAEYKWLQNDLATHPSALKFAFFHYPLYADNANEPSDTFLQGETGLEGLLNRYGVDIAFTGHAHLYQRNNPTGSAGIDNFVTGGGGAQLSPIAAGSLECSPFDAFGVGWSYSANGGLGAGSACGTAAVPTDPAQVHHFLLVNVDDSGATVRAIDARGQTLDSASYPRSTANADLAVSQSDSPEPAFNGRRLTYNLSVRNDGPANATGVTLTDNLPSGVTYESANPTQGTCSETAGVVTCELGDLASGASATVELRVTPNQTGSITNSASVVGDNHSDPVTSNNSSSESTRVLEAIDLSIVKSDATDPVAVGDELVYTLAVRNDGTLNASGVTVTDNLPGGVTYGSATPSQGTCNEASGTVTCDLGDLASNATASVEIRTTAGSEGTVTNTATVAGGGENDPDTANNSDSEDTAIRPKADLSITKADTPDPLFAGQTLTYNIAVANLGPSDASGVTVTDDLPAGVTYQSAVPSQGSCSEAGGSVTCALGTVANTGGATIELKVTARNAGTIDNTASVKSDAVDPSAGNDSATTSTTVNPAADLSITKTDSPDPVLAGQQLIFTLTVRNNGPSTATGVTAVDTLPAGVNYESSIPSQGSCLTVSLGTISCGLGTIASGGTATVQISVRPQNDGVITNQATVSGIETDLVMSNNQSSATTTVTPAADLEITKAGPADGLVGQQMTYTLTVRNNGPSAATGVTTVDSLPASVSYVSASASQGTCTLTGTTVRCTLGSLASGATATATIRVNATKQGNTTNTATVSGGQIDPVSANNTSSVITKVKKK
jgi:uncharacterized repeat protein (TIGR01451 family)